MNNTFHKIIVLIPPVTIVLSEVNATFSLLFVRFKAVRGLGLSISVENTVITINERPPSPQSRPNPCASSLSEIFKRYVLD